MNLSAILMIINVALLWWLFLSSSRMFVRILLVLLALLNTWVALERFHVLPTRLGGRTLIRSHHRIQDARPRGWENKA